MSTIVTLYTKPGCVQCNATKRHFARQGIDPDQSSTDFQVIDVSEDTAAAEHLIAAGHQQLPVVMVEDDETGESEAWGGFIPPKVAEAASALHAQRAAVPAS